MLRWREEDQRATLADDLMREAGRRVHRRAAIFWGALALFYLACVAFVISPVIGAIIDAVTR